MKKLLFVLLFPCIACATQNTINGNLWSGASIQTTDTIINAGGTAPDTIDGDFSIVTYRRPATNNRMQAKTATPTITITGNGPFFVDSGITGTKIWPSWIWQGNGIAKVAANSGTITASTSNLQISGIDTFTMNKSTTFANFTIDSSKQLTLNGSADPLQFAGITTINGTLNMSAPFYVRCIAQAVPLVLGASYSITGSNIFYIQHANSAAKTFPIPAISLGGTVALIFYRGTNSYNNAVDSMTGNIIVNNANIFIKGSAGDNTKKLTFKTNGYSITQTSPQTLYVGCDAADRLWMYFDSSKINIGEFNSNTYNSDSTFISLDSSTWRVFGSWTNGTKTKFINTTSRSTVIFKNTATLTSAGQIFNDIVDSVGATKAFTLADSLQCRNLTVQSGKLKTAGKAIRASGNLSLGGADSIILSNVTMTGDNTTIRCNTLWTKSATGSKIMLLGAHHTVDLCQESSMQIDTLNATVANQEIRLVPRCAQYLTIGTFIAGNASGRVSIVSDTSGVQAYLSVPDSTRVSNIKFADIRSENIIIADSTCDLDSNLTNIVWCLPDISYDSATAYYTVGSAITTLAVTNSGCTADSFTVAPTLPTGLSLNATTGAVTGTPSAASAAADYVFTAYNNGGTSTALDTVNITVADKGLLQSAGISYNNNSASSTKLGFANQCKKDSLIIVIGAWYNGASNPATISDNIGNTFTKFSDTIDHGMRVSGWYAFNKADGSDSITVTYSSAATYRKLAIHEFAGFGNLDSAKTTAAYFSSGTDGVKSDSLTTTTDTSLIFGFAVETNNSLMTTSGTGFTSAVNTSSPDNSFHINTEFKKSVATGKKAASFTINTNDYLIVGVAAFKAGTGTPPDPPAGPCTITRGTKKWTVDSVGCLCVKAAIDSASSGDTIQLPTGTAKWKTTTQGYAALTITKKNIVIKGRGRDSTIIIDSIDVGGSGGYSNHLIDVIGDSTTTGFRLCSLKIVGNGYDPTNTGRWVTKIYMNGRKFKNWRLDHIYFDSCGAPIATNGYQVWGLIDNCYFNKISSNMDIRGGSDSSWLDPPTPGTSNAVYIENDTFNITGTLGAVVDGSNGGNYVFRYNKITGGYALTHGYCCNLTRGFKWFEIYNNTFTAGGATENNDNPIGIRGGSGVIFNNTITNGVSNWNKTDISLQNDRSCNSDYQGQVGDSSWYAGNPTWLHDGWADSTGWPGRDQIGTSYDSTLQGNQARSPLYIWGNMFGTDTVGTYRNSPCAAESTHVKVNRDYYMTTKPEYTEYTYPHPLRNQQKNTINKKRRSFWSSLGFGL